MPNGQSFIFVVVDVASSIPVSITVSILQPRIRLETLHLGWDLRLVPSLGLARLSGVL